MHKNHNVTVLLYYMVFSAKYRRVVFDVLLKQVLRKVLLDIDKRYQIKFLEIGTYEDYVYFLL